MPPGKVLNQSGKGLQQMDSNEIIIQQLKQQQLLPLFYHHDAEVCIGITKALYAAGIRVIEFTNRGEHALQNFKALIAERDKSIPDLLLAVGTICTSEQASKFIQAGADFLISPVFDAGVYDVTYFHKILWIPACMTPTEIQVAANSGCRLIKLFPGNVLGPGFVNAIKELFPSIDFMATGGVDATAENMEAWFNAGVCAVGMGSKLISKSMMEQKNYPEIEHNTRAAMALIQSIKNKP
jgi:2-dehydro-3-deoxyphosphogluconate aldolase / (4S)-4-hydroxy-2-oxoglutarate aldolase